MNIGIIGLGVVGMAIYQAFSNYTDYNLVTYDIKDQNSSFDSILKTDCVFICVPTNLNADNWCDISIVESFVHKLIKKNYTGLIIIKSTVIPGTTENLISKYSARIAFVPEFLRQAHAYNDFVSKKYSLIIGTHSISDFEFIQNIHSNIVDKFKQLTPAEAELTKYFCNNFNAVRITFANIYYEVSKKLGADYSSILDASKLSALYTNGDYLDCNENLRGFSGACLPKDLQAFDSFLKTLELPYRLLNSSLHDNTYFKN